ncbi:hypothetical protein JCM10207_001168 [Rhodosporidiobolus poonsookiae]
MGYDSSLPRYEPLPPSAAPFHDFADESKRSRRLGHLVGRSPLRAWAPVVLALLFGVVLGWSGGQGRTTGERGAAREKAGTRDEVGEFWPSVWQAWGRNESVGVGTRRRRPEGLPPCERTLLVDWSSFHFGFGSMSVAVFQAAVFAQAHNYTLLFSRQAGNYGGYLDHFAPAPLPCSATEEQYDPASYAKSDSYARVQDILDNSLSTEKITRTIAGDQDIYALNYFIRNITYSRVDLDSLPDLDAFRPLPANATVPPLYRLRLLDVHFRGGDKLARECRPSSQLSCGNITLHCETALNTLPTLSPLFPNFDLDRAHPAKPRLLLMTAEPDALKKFRDDPVCQKFELLGFEDEVEGKGFVQDEWNRQSELARLEDTRRMLSEGDLLTNRADAFVVSANSNSARFMLVRAGPARTGVGLAPAVVRSVDIPWHPVQFPPFKGACDGMQGNCFPG